MRPDAARESCIEDAFDPPLCCALRQGRDLGVVRLLVQGGADLEGLDVGGFSPLSLLCDRALAALDTAPAPPAVEALQHGLLAQDMASLQGLPRFMWASPGDSSSNPWTEQWAIRVASVLLAAGAAPEQPDAKGRTAIKLACAGGPALRHFAALLEHYTGAQACHALQQAIRCVGATQGPRISLRALPSGIIDVISGYLVPPRISRHIASTGRFS